MSVKVTSRTITVDLEDGRTISVPTAWYPRLKHATAAERANYEIDDVGICWPDLEADFSVRGLLQGRKSGEAPESFQFWLEHRRQGRHVTFQDYMKHRKTVRNSKTKRKAG